MKKGSNYADWEKINEQKADLASFALSEKDSRDLVYFAQTQAALELGRKRK